MHLHFQWAANIASIKRTGEPFHLSHFMNKKGRRLDKSLSEPTLRVPKGDRHREGPEKKEKRENCIFASPRLGFAQYINILAVLLLTTYKTRQGRVWPPPNLPLWYYKTFPFPFPTL